MALGLARDERICGHLPISQGVDQRGRATRSILPRGVSGSGLWLRGSEQPRLLATFTDAPGDRCVATPVIVHALLLRKAFPILYRDLAA